MKKLEACLFAGLFTFGSSAAGASLYGTGFEPTAYTAGLLSGQGGWTGNRANVQTATFRSGVQSVQLNSIIGSNASAFSPFTFNTDSSPEKIIRIGIDAFRVASANPDFWTVLSVLPSTGRIDFNVDQNGDVSVYDGNVSHTTTGVLSAGTWARFELVLNFATRKFDAFKDGVQIFSGGTFGGTGGGFSSIAFYSQGFGNQLAYFDNITVDSSIGAPALSITKSHTGNFTQGGQGTYTITVGNTGTAATPSGPIIQVFDTPPSGMTVVSMVGSGWLCATGSLNGCNRGDSLPAGQSHPPITVTVNVAANAPSSLTNVATASGGGTTGSVVSSDPTTITPQSAPPTIVSFTANPTTISPGGASTLSWAVNNASTVTITGLGNVAPSGSTQVNPTATTTYTLTATNSSGPVTASVTVVVGVPGSPLLSITKSHTGNFSQGQQGTYIITVRNVGTAATPNGPIVQVFDNPPSGMAVTSMVGSGWICATGSLNGCNRGDSLPAGQSYPPITVTVSVSPSAPSTLTNIATAAGGGTSATVTASDPTTIVAAGSPAFSITKSHSGNFIQGQQGVYAISLRNTGTAATSSGALVEVVDDPPAGMTVISMAGSGWTCTTGSQNMCNRVDSLPSTQSYPNITVTVRIASDAPVALTNLAAARGGGTAGVVSATDPTIIAAGGAPRLSITKSHSGSFTQGQQGTYTIAVSNTGTAPTSAGASVQVVETPPAGMTVTTIAGSGWNCGPFSSLIGCSRTDSLPAGQSYAAITVNVSIAPNAPSSLTNVATVTGGGTTDTITATDQTTISTPSAPILSLTKSHNGSFTQGQEGIYTIRLRNTGMGATPSGSVFQVFENPPNGMTVISMAGQGWVCDVRLQNACTRADSLSAGQSYPDIAVTVRVAANAPSSLTNVATASGGGTSGTVSASDPTAILPGTGSILTPTAGTRQFAGVNSPFATPLQVTLSNGGAPVSGAAVTFKAPLTGASGTWAGSTTVTATTDAFGRAVAPIFTANQVGGTYGVTATTGTVSTVFTLTNTSATTTTTTLVSPHSMGFNFTPGGPTTLTKSITISNSVTGSVPITYRVLFPNSQAANWLSVAPASLNTPAVLRVTADSRGFPPGRYLALIVVSAAQRSTGSAAQSFTPTSNLGTQVLSPEDVASDPGQAIPGTDHVLAATMVVPGSSPVKLSEPRCIWMSADTTPPAANRTPEEIDQDCSYRKSRDPLSVSVEASANTATDFEVSVTLLPNETDWLTARLKENPFASGTSLTGTTVSTITVDVQKDLLSYDTQLAYIQITNGTRGSDVAMVNAVKGPSLAVSPAVLNINADGSSATAVSPDAKDIGGSQKTATSTEQNITVSTSAGTLPFTVSSDVPWLSFRPASGTASPGNPVSIAVSADTSAIGSSGGGGSILIQRTDSLRSATAVSVIADRAVAGAPVITSVLNGASFQSPGIAPGSWVTIKGTGLSNTDNGRIWIASDFIAGKLPLSLDGVSVTINGVPAYVEYVSPTQLNVLAPGESARGEVAVIVKNNGKASAPVSAQMQTFSPAFFQFGKYAIAQRIPDLALLGNPALGSAFLSAKPGDIVTLWVTGLGPTAPAGQEGMLPTGGAAIANAPTVQLGGKALPAANVLGSAISSFAGAYQVAIRIPEVIEEGDVPITISVGGFASPEGVFLHVKK